jgi:uncharacterized repeat protein (TIGR01451 family)
MKSSRSRHRIHPVTKLPDLLTRLVLVSSIASLGSGNLLTAVMALPPTPGTEIKNTAVGSFLDEDAPAANTSTVVESNEVTVTVAEVAGITITSGGIIGSTGLGGLAYFDFILTNVGNDPTQFFIPGAPSAITGGSMPSGGKIKIIGYDSDGNGSAAEVPLDVNIPLTALVTTSGGTTGSIALLGSNAIANNGSIPAGGTIRIRVPIQIAATGVISVSVTMGNTTPANGQNQSYAAGTGNKDVYTVDNSDNTSGEALGLLSSLQAREASTTQTLTITGTNTPDPTSAGAPFDCDPYFYMLHDSGSFTQLYKIDRQTSTYGESIVIGGGFSPPVKLNALGYNPIDRYFYAMSSTLGSYNVLYRIGKNNAVPLGIVQPNGASLLPTTSSFVSGTFDDSGNYYISNGTTLHKIAISGNTPTLISSTVFLGIGSAGDIAFNPSDRKLYAANKSATTGINLQRIEDLATSSSSTTITTSLSTNTTVTGSIGAIFFDSIGTLYAYSDTPTAANGGGSPSFYQMPNVKSGATTITYVSSAPDSGSSDGASCPFISPRIDVVKSVGTVTKVNSTTFDVPFTIKVGNAGSNSSPNVQVTENLVRAFTTTPTISVPILPTITSTPSNGLCTLNPSFDGKTAGQMKLLTGTNTLSGGANCTISLTARLTYGSVGAIPTAVQNNSVYASTTINSNPGHTFATDAALTPIYPPDLLDADTSNNSSALPLSVHTDSATPTPITLPTSSNPNVLLIKRITAINGLPNRTTGESIAGYENFNTYDDNTISFPAVVPPDTNKWPNPVANFLVGTTDGGKVKPNDSIDYTIYFLSAGDSTANNVLLCDRVPANVTFNPNTFTNTTANPSGAARGIAVQLGSNSPNYYTNTADSDPARYFPPGIEPNTVYPKINCGRDPLYPNDSTKFLPNDNGAVVVNLGNQSAGAYGFVRFRGLVK